MDVFAAVAAKAVGALSGAVFALVFIKPASWRELASRAIGAPLAGFMLAAPVRDHVLEWAPTDEATAGAALVCAFASWWAAGAVVRLLRHYGPAK